MSSRRSTSAPEPSVEERINHARADVERDPLSAALPTRVCSRCGNPAKDATSSLAPNLLSLRA